MRYHSGNIAIPHFKVSMASKVTNIVFNVNGGLVDMLIICLIQMIKVYSLTFHRRTE